MFVVCREQNKHQKSNFGAIPDLGDQGPPTKPFQFYLSLIIDFYDTLVCPIYKIFSKGSLFRLIQLA